MVRSDRSQLPFKRVVFKMETQTLIACFCRTIVRPPDHSEIEIGDRPSAPAARHLRGGAGYQSANVVSDVATLYRVSNDVLDVLADQLLCQLVSELDKGLMITLEYRRVNLYV
jgi:hypothetical protein